MSGGVTFDTDLATLTVDKFIRKSVTDNVFSEHGLLGWIEKSVGVDREKGGHRLLIPLETSANTDGGSYSGYDVFDNSPSEHTTNAVYSFKHYQKPIVAPFDEIALNQNESGVINMWMTKAENTLKSLRADLNTDAFADGTGNGGKNMLGLTILVDSTGTVGNIARATNAFWAGQETGSGGTLAVSGATGMIQVYNDCSTGSGDQATPNAIWTTQAIHQFYEALLEPDIRHTSQQTGDGTFSGLAFKGVPLAWDAVATTQIMYFLNAASFEAYVHPDRDFVTTQIAKADDGTLNQDAWVSNILVYIELALAESRRNGKLTGITS